MGAVITPVDDTLLEQLATGHRWSRQAEAQAMAVELVAVRAFLAPTTGNTLRDRLAELHDLLCTISARCDDEHVIWDDLQTAIGLAETLTDDAEAVTP